MPKIRIVRPPTGEAPDWVRQAWVGLELHTPIDAGAFWTTGALSGAKSWIGCVWDMLRGRTERLTGYPVDTTIAVDCLATSNPDAANWWRVNTPHLFGRGRMLVFDMDACALIAEPSAPEASWQHEAHMKVQPVSPDPRCAAFLANADFADAYRVGDADPHLGALAAAQRMTQPLPWVSFLLAIRNLLVAPFGLKDGHERLPAGVTRLGIFPLLSESPDRVVLGMDDKHLDFRVVIDAPGTGEVTGTTLVRTHNRLGRLYLRLVLPFHRVIVQRMMRQIGAEKA